ncbi:MAG: hypothetical protein ACK4VO_02520 [Pseudobdellovibrio sp.]
MKYILTVMLFTHIAQATNLNHCNIYSNKERYLKAISAVAATYNLDLNQICTSEKYLAIEAQPSRKYTREGELIPHVRVQLHMYSSSCLYMVKDADLTITEMKCYSGE